MTNITFGDGYFGSGTSIQIPAKPLTGYVFAAFRGALTGNDEPTNSGHVWAQDSNDDICSSLLGFNAARAGLSSTEQKFPTAAEQKGNHLLLDWPFP